MAATGVLLPQIVNNALTVLLLQIKSNTQNATQLPALPQSEQTPESLSSHGDVIFSHGQPTIAQVTA